MACVSGVYRDEGSTARLCRTRARGGGTPSVRGGGLPQGSQAGEGPLRRVLCARGCMGAAGGRQEAGSGCRRATRPPHARGGPGRSPQTARSGPQAQEADSPPGGWSGAPSPFQHHFSVGDTCLKSGPSAAPSASARRTLPPQEGALSADARPAGDGAVRGL